MKMSILNAQCPVYMEAVLKAGFSSFYPLNLACQMVQGHQKTQKIKAAIKTPQKDSHKEV